MKTSRKRKEKQQRIPTLEQKETKRKPTTIPKISTKVTEKKPTGNQTETKQKPHENQQ